MGDVPSCGVSVPARDGGGSEPRKSLIHIDKVLGFGAPLLPHHGPPVTHCFSERKRGAQRIAAPHAPVTPLPHGRQIDGDLCIRREPMLASLLGGDIPSDDNPLTEYSADGSPDFCI